MASIIAGVLWEQVGPQATCLAGAGFAALAVLGVGLLDRALRRRKPAAGQG